MTSPPTVAEAIASLVDQGLLATVDCGVEMPGERDPRRANLGTTAQMADALAAKRGALRQDLPPRLKRRHVHRH